MDQEASDVREALNRDREELAGTVEALAQKADVKGRARDAVQATVDQIEGKASEVREQIRDLTPKQAEAGLQSAMQTVTRVTRERPMPALAATLAAGLVLGWIVGRR